MPWVTKTTKKPNMIWKGSSKFKNNLVTLYLIGISKNLHMVFIVAIYDNVAAIILHEFQETLYFAGKSSIPNAIPWPTNLCANCCSPCVFTKKWFYHVKIFAQNLWTVAPTYFREISEIESNVAFWQLKLTDQDLAFPNQVRKEEDQSLLDLEQLDANYPWSLISFTKKTHFHFLV